MQWANKNHTFHVLTRIKMFKMYMITYQSFCAVSSCVYMNITMRLNSYLINKRLINYDLRDTII